MMNRLSLVAILLITSSVAFAQQDQAVGIRLGSPMGISYKMYLPKHRAVEFLVGSAPNSWNKGYIENSFKDYSKFDGDQYVSHTVRSTIYLQARYLVQYPLELDLEGNFEWYWGAGALLKGSKVNYRYRKIDDPVLYSGSKNDVDLGIEAPVGLEYTFANVPINLFMELSPTVEIVDRAGLRMFFGMGGRYKF